MIAKHPALRVHSSVDIPSEYHKELAEDCFKYISLTPFADLVTDVVEVGSYAREQAELHSDLDLNIEFATPEDLAEAKERIQANREQFRQAIQFLGELWKKWGTRISFAMFDYQVSKTPKSYYSLKEMKYYPRIKERVDEIGGEFVERVRIQLAPPKLGMIVHDEETDSWRPFNPETDTHDMYDPWYNELPKWRELLGGKLLEYGDTEETSWMKHGSSDSSGH